MRAGEPPAALPSCDEVLDGLCDLFRWQEGRFTFDQRTDHEDMVRASGMQRRGADPARLPQSGQLGHHPATWLPSDDTIFEVGSAASTLERLALTPGEERVVAAVDGVKDVATVARELDLTLFETSRIFYCLAAIGVLRTADLDKIRLRRVFREIAELMCTSTIPWRAQPGRSRLRRGGQP